jgi:hypothetical protein
MAPKVGDKRPITQRTSIYREDDDEDDDEMDKDSNNSDYKSDNRRRNKKLTGGIRRKDVGSHHSDKFNDKHSEYSMDDHSKG